MIYKDLEIYSHDGGAGPNYGNNYYIYNPTSKQFDYCDKMSELSQPSIDAKTQTIYAAWRNGAANHGAEKYKWLKRKLTLVEYYETIYIDEDKITEIHQKLVNGKMKRTIKTIRESQIKYPF